nr:ankyrin repeat-containing protein [Tanacetum cinerariifolium]
MAAKKIESLEADLAKYREEVKGDLATLGNKLDSEVEALMKRQELEDKRYEVKNMLLEPFRSWEELKRRLLDRFQPSQEGNLYEQFLAITQDGSAREYVGLFEEKYKPGHRCAPHTLHVMIVDDSDAAENEPYLQVKPWDHALKAD